MKLFLYLTHPTIFHEKAIRILTLEGTLNRPTPPTYSPPVNRSKLFIPSCPSTPYFSSFFFPTIRHLLSFLMLPYNILHRLLFIFFFLLFLLTLIFSLLLLCLSFYLFITDTAGGSSLHPTVLERKLHHLYWRQ